MLFQARLSEAEMAYEALENKEKKIHGKTDRIPSSYDLFICR